MTFILKLHKQLLEIVTSEISVDTTKMANVLDIDTIYFGNPVFDITVQDDNSEMMNRYGLELRMACLASPE